MSVILILSDDEAQALYDVVFNSPAVALDSLRPQLYSLTHE